MLKKLMARPRALRLGAGLLGASVLAVGFASPAFANAVERRQCAFGQLQHLSGWLEHDLPDDEPAGQPVQRGARL